MPKSEYPTTLMPLFSSLLENSGFSVSQPNPASARKFAKSFVLFQKIGKIYQGSRVIIGTTLKGDDL